MIMRKKRSQTLKSIHICSYLDVQLALSKRWWAVGLPGLRGWLRRDTRELMVRRCSPVLIVGVTSCIHLLNPKLHFKWVGFIAYKLFLNETELKKNKCSLFSFRSFYFKNLPEVLSTFISMRKHTLYIKMSHCSLSLLTISKTFSQS